MSIKSRVSVLWNMSAFILYVLFSELMVSSVLFAFRVNISKITLPLSIIVAIIVWCVVNKNTISRELMHGVILGVFSIILVTVAMGKLYNDEWDGNSYHKLAVGMMKNGWNPMYESVEDAGIRYFGVGPDQIDTKAIFLDHYAKASWQWGAAVYALTQNIECGKGYSVLAAIALFGVLFTYMYMRNCNIRSTFVFCIIAVSNPVFISQMTTYYLDGYLATLLFMLIVGLTMLIDKYDDSFNKYAWTIIFPSMTLLGNVKFNGLLYGGCFCVIFYIFSCIQESVVKKNEYPRKIISDIVFNPRIVRFIILAINTICVAGNVTYLKNLIDHGTPGYPLMGANMDVLTGQGPDDFRGRSTLYKIFYSLFGRGDGIWTDEEGIKHLPQLKVPFTFTINEIKWYRYADLRSGGFGPLFSGILIISLLIIILFLTRIYKEEKGMFVYSCVLIGMVTALLVTISASWWARIAPFMYVYAVFALYILLFKSNVLFRGIKKSKLKTRNILICIYTCTMLINSGVCLANPIRCIKISGQIGDGLKDYSGKTLQEVNCSTFYGVLFDLDDANVGYLYDECNTNPSHVLYNGLIGFEKVN